MPKLGVGVGEEFPVDEPSKETRADESRRHCGPGGSWHHRWFFARHVLFWVLIVALAIGAASMFFERHHDPDHFHGFYPYPHHFFFPVFPIVLILLVIAFSRRGHHRGRHWHSGRHGNDGEGT